MDKFNISVPRKYTNKAGEEKTFWNTVGSLTRFPAKEGKPEGFKLELPIFGNTDFFVFPAKEREDKIVGGY